MAEPMRRWVLTGPAGAGKSLLSGWLAGQGAVPVSADALGHAVLTEPAVIAAVREAFGPGVLRGGAVDRPALGRLVFAEPAALARLDAITHPRLARRIDARMRELAAAGTALAVLEAAVYFLLPPLEPVDLVIAVVAGVRTRLARLIAGGLPEAEARQRLAAQEALARDWARADILLENEGTPNELYAAARRALGDRWRHVPQPRDERGERP